MGTLFRYWHLEGKLLRRPAVLAVREVQARVGFWVDRKYPLTVDGEEQPAVARELRLDLEAHAFAGFVREYAQSLPKVHEVWANYEGAMERGARRPDKGETGNGKVSFVVLWPDWRALRVKFDPVRSHAKRRSCKEPELVAFAVFLGELKPEQLASKVDMFLLTHPVVKELNECSNTQSGPQPSAS